MDLGQVADYQLYQGDCLEVMPTIEAGSVDAIICDPPYGVTNCSWDSVIPLEPLWSEYKRLIKPNGAIVLFASQPFTSVLVTSNLEWFKYEWMWDKNLATGGQNVAFMPMKSHESILVFSNGRGTYNPQMEKLTQAEIKRLRYRDYDRPMGESYGKARMITKGRAKILDEGALKHPRSIIRINGVHACSSEKKLWSHPSQKSTALMEYLVKTYTNPGDLILDNCFGSCTTGVACINLGRRFIGIEKDPTYFKIGQERMAKRMAELEAERLAPKQLALEVAT